MRSPRQGLILGAVLGTLWVAGQRGFSEAHAVLFFPPPLVLAETPRVEVEGGQKVADALVDYEDPSHWARDLLTSKEAVDMICKRVERTEADTSRSQVMRSAVLLSEGDRVVVETLPNASVRLRVKAETPRAALILCEGLVAYLTFKAKIPLEDPEAARLTELQQQLRVQEKALSKALWGMMAFGSPKTGTPMDSQSLDVDLQDYRSRLRQYQALAREHFFRQTRSAASGPGFVVLEPPGVASAGRPWWKGILSGGLMGLVASLLLRGGQRVSASRKNVRWRVQEGRFRDRTASPE